MTERTRHLFYAVTSAAIAAIAFIVWRIPPDGIDRSTFLQFLGRFHPLVVHFPIGLVLLTAVLECAGFFRSGKYLQAAAGFVLALATASALVAVWLGWVLAWSGGYEGSLVTRHMFGGISLAGALLLCCVLRPWKAKIYGVALAGTVFLLMWTSDQGGKLTHGEAYLTEYMPSTLRAALHVSPPPAKRRALGSTSSPLPNVTSIASSPAASGTASTSPMLSVAFFDARVAPIFNDKCLTCHGPAKKKGKLRLDTFEQVMLGGKHGAVVKAGDPDASEIVRRISLPRDDEHAMPAEGKPALTDDERRVIVYWIASGAAKTAIAGDSPHSLEPPPAPETPPSPLTPDYRSRSEMIQTLQSKLAVRLVPRSENPRDGLTLRTFAAPTRCDDAVLAALSPIADLIVDAELSRTRITDAGLKTLSTFSNLHSLDISHTSITAHGLAPLIRLTKLESLNLTATDVDDQGVLPFRRKAGLKHLFLFETKCLEQ